MACGRTGWNNIGSVKMNRNRKAWIVVLIAFLGGTSLALVQNKVAPCILAIMEYFNISMLTAGWLLSAFSIMGIAIAIPAAFIINCLGPKKSGMISLACAIVGSLLGVFTDSVAVLLLSRVVEGLGVGLISVVGPALISMWFPVEKRGLPMGIWASWQMVAQAAMFFVGGVLTVNYGWQGMWWFALIICVIAAVLYQWKVESPPAGSNYADAETADVSLVEGLKSKSAWLLAGAAMFFCISCFGFATWIAPYWSQAFGWDIDSANKWVSYTYMLEVLLVIMVGWYLDRVRDRKKVGVIAGLLYTFVLLYSFRMNSPQLILPFIIIYPLLEGTIPTVLWTIAPQTVEKPELAAMALGLMNLGLYVGITIGPPLTGAVIETYGWAAGTIPIAISSLIVTVFMSKIKIHDHSVIVSEELILEAA